jgi:hypothetical protein
MGAGLVIGGIILLVIGIGAYVYLGNLKGQAEEGQVLCHSLFGQAGQLLSSNIDQKCQQAEEYAPILRIGYFVGIAFGIIGFIIAMAGGIGMGIRAAKR